MAKGDEVHVAVFVFKGVLAGLEVFSDPEAANRRADEWREKADELDAVSVEDREVK